VVSGDVDLAIGPDRTTGTAVQATALFDSPWVLWCAPGHPLARRRTAVRWVELAGVAIVSAGRDHEHNVAQMHRDRPAGTRVTPVDVVDNISTALGIAAQGLAVTLAPAYVAVLARPLGLVMKRVIEPESVRKVCLYAPAGRTTSPAAAGFADFLADWIRQWAVGI
jgi:DNA-binding transcriptional LysR family regulator